MVKREVMPSKVFRVLNLRAGVQSTVLYLMAIDGELSFDVAIFADTGDEPSAVYDHVAWLRKLGGPAIYIVSAGNLGDNLVRGINATGQRFVSIPAFLSDSDDGKNSGIGRRQCTSEYKILPIEQEIRRLLGVMPKQRIPKHVSITQIFGLSFDEPKRVARVKLRYAMRKQWKCEFPLFDDFMTRGDCQKYLKERIPNIHVPRSACVYCPYRNNDEWQHLKDTDPVGWRRAVEVDEAIRDPLSVCTRDTNAKQYLHRDCVPLVQIDFKAKPSRQQNERLDFAQMDCEGMCGV